MQSRPTPPTLLDELIELVRTRQQAPGQPFTVIASYGDTLIARGRFGHLPVGPIVTYRRIS